MTTMHDADSAHSKHSGSASPSMTLPIVEKAPAANKTPRGSISSTAVESTTPAAPSPFANKGRAFWMVFIALMASCFLSALDLTSVSTALPSMAADLKSDKYSWIGSAYALTSTALIPWTGGLANIFGRRPTMLGSLVIFCVGSIVTASANSMNIAILGRAIQGVGGGGILTMTEIIVTDLVPLAERGAYFGILGSVWAIASAIGPPIGGALAAAGAWRWLFWLNLPLSALAITLVAFFLKIKSPQTTMKEKLAQMDYVNIIFVGGATSVILAITWGGVTYPWNSYQVLIPLVLGFVAMGIYIWLEKVYVKYPTVPFEILRQRTSLLGFLTTFLHGIVTLAAIYYFTVYFQASKGATPKQAGVDVFSLSFTIAPFAIITGISVTIVGKYKVQNILGWALTAIGFGLSSLIKWDSSKAAWVGYPIIMGIGMGLLYTATNFAVLAPLKPSEQPQAMAFYGFSRAFGQVWGIAVGATILQNELNRKLPESFLARFEGNGEIAFSIMGTIKDLAEPLRSQVRAAFADSLRIIWLVMVGVAGLGFLLSIFIQDITLTQETDEKWGMKEAKKTPVGHEEEEKRVENLA